MLAIIYINVNMGDKKCKYKRLFNLFHNCNELCITFGSSKPGQSNVCLLAIIKNGLESMSLLYNDRRQWCSKT